jgi:uncharacterized protein YbjT (DUF2867 family)
VTGVHRHARPILVLGGTGRTGRRIVGQLDRRGHAVRVGSRRAEPALDSSDRATREAAVQGVRATYVLDPADVGAEDGAAVLRDFCALAVAGGTRRLVFLSSRDLGNAGDAGLVERERVVQESGADWTILQSV